MSRVAWLTFGAIVLLYIAMFSRARNYEFVWDDLATLRDDPQFDRPLREGLFVTQHGHMNELVSQRGVAPAHESYRPVVFLSYAADVALFGRSAHAMHVHNVLLGLACIPFVLALALRFLQSAWAAIGVTAFFALHPLHVEPVCYLSARADLLSGLFALVAMVLVPWAPGARLRRLRVAGACLAYFLSLFAKESALGLPLAVLALALATGRWRAMRGPIAAMLATTIVFFVTRRLAIGNAPTAPRADVLWAVLNLPGLVLDFMSEVLWPRGLSIVRPNRHSYLVPGWIAVAALVLASFVVSRKNGKLERHARVALAGLAFSLFLVGPTAVVVEIMKVVADRYAFLPLFGFGLSAAAALMWLGDVARRWLRPVLAAVATWGVFAIGNAFAQVPVWRNETTLYESSLAAVPDSAIAHYRVGYLRAGAGRWEEAVDELREAFRLDPTYLATLNNLGVAYLNLDRLDEAQHALERAIVLSEGTNVRAWYNLSVVYRARGKPKKSCAALEQALSLNSSYTKARDDAARYCSGAEPSQR